MYNLTAAIVLAHEKIAMALSGTTERPPYFHRKLGYKEILSKHPENSKYRL